MELEQMDIAREPKPRRNRILLVVILGLGLFGVTLALSHLKNAAPEVERQSLVIDTVKRGAMEFQVRGAGILVPVDVRMITALVPCKVESILLFPGAAVQENSVIAELSSPELKQSCDDALWQMRRAEADFEVDRQNQVSLLKTARANAREAEATLQALNRLSKENLISELDLLRAKTKVEDGMDRVASEEARMQLYSDSTGKLAPARARLEQAKALFALKRKQMASLRVRAGMDGVLQQVPLQVGQQLTQGASLAKIAKPMPLKAELKVSESQAKDVIVGQSVKIDTRNGIVKGRVIRIDPAVVNGTVTVDASLEGELPKGVRPDLNIEGIIELDHVENALYAGRPVQAQPFGSISVFKLSSNGNDAVRVKVKLGRLSVSTVEILGGLKEGDQVILSDISQYDSVDKINLK